MRIALLIGAVLFADIFLPANVCSWPGLSNENAARKLPAKLSKADTLAPAIHLTSSGLRRFVGVQASRRKERQLLVGKVDV